MLLAVYSLKPFMLRLLWLLWLIPMLMGLISYLTVRKNRIATEKKWAEDDERIAAREAEIAAEKALEDDFGYDKFNDDGEYIGDDPKKQ